MLTRTRQGGSLAELMLALALAGLVMASASASLLRQQRGLRWVGEVTGADAQLRPLARILSAELALLDPASGDLAPGAATDSTLQIRATIATSLSCDSSAAVVTLVPEGGAGVAIAGTARPPGYGDSVWFYTDSLGWRGRRVVSTSRVSARCLVPATPTGVATRLTLDAPADVAGATPLRVTRQERYVLYRATGAWYFGLSDWSAVTARFAPPQPIAGPFVRSASSASTTGFRYFDSSGGAVVPDGTNERTIARVRVRGAANVGSAGGAPVVRSDSADIAMGASGAP